MKRDKEGRKKGIKSRHKRRDEIRREESKIGSGEQSRDEESRGEMI